MMTLVTGSVRPLLEPHAWPHTMYVNDYGQVSTGMSLYRHAITTLVNRDFNTNVIVILTDF